MKISMIAYDIPTDCRLPNPSAELRRIGFRINLSTWAIPTHLLPWGLIHEYEQEGTTWTPAVEFSEREADKLRGMAVAALRQEISEALQAAEAGQATAQANAEERGERGLRRYKGAAQCNLSRTRRLLRDVEDAAQNLAIPLEQLGMQGAQLRVAQLRSELLARAAVYARAADLMRAAGETNTTDSFLAEAARQNQLNPLVMADRLEELGECNTAEALRDMFG